MAASNVPLISGTEWLEALPVAIYTTDAEGRITFYNGAAAEFWGQRPEIGSLWCGSWRLFSSGGKPLPHEECPMARALKSGEAIRGIEAIAERPDGTRVRFTPYPTPIKDEAGRVIGGINLLIDVTDRRRSQFLEARLAAIVASSNDAIISKTLEGRVTSWNDGATRIFGYDAQEMIGQPIMRLIPPELQDEEIDILARLSRGEHIEHYETVRLAKDGRRIDVSLSVSPLRDQSGQIVGASKVARDVTDRKRSEKLQQLLIEELNHRVKNTLAMVQAIATQSLVRAKNHGDFVSSFTNRVHALAKAHSLLTRTSMQGADLMDLIRDQVLLGSQDDRRITCSGPAMMLDAQIAVHLAMVLHELATNARKYGALSVPSGRLTVTWEMRSNEGRYLFLNWEERNGPKVNAPTTRGFGSSLIEHTLRAHDGKVSLQYATDGVSCQITLPLPQEESGALRDRKVHGTEMIALKPQEDPSDFLRGKRILIVEDEPLIAMEMESILQSRGVKIVGLAGTIEQAERVLGEQSCDAALLDISLGGEPADGIAAHLTQKQIPFAFVTGRGRKDLPPHLQEGVILTKPFDRDQLLAVVEVLLYVARPGSDILQFRRRP